MDRRRRRAEVGVLLALIGGAAVAAGAAPPLRALLWVSKDADAVRLFATAPTECLRRPDDPKAALSVEVGRAAFRSPLLLGGQAARAGLSCEACHRSGRGNPDFQFPGASGAPGTADVTLSLFSSHRGNGVHDPKPIPDLSVAKGKLKVDQARAAGKLEPFIHGLIAEEFDGPEPPAAVLAGLGDYVRALDPAACPAGGRAPVTVAGLMDDAVRAVRAAEAALAGGDRATAVVMLAAARAGLFLIDERYAALPAERARIRGTDAELARLQAAVREGRPDAGAGLARWRAGAPALTAALEAREAASLFNPARLRAATKRRLPARAS